VLDWAKRDVTRTTASALAAVALVTGVTAVATWGDGSPEPWIWFSIVTAPLGVVGGIVTWYRTGGKAAFVVSGIVTAFWLLVFLSLLLFGRG
jgi:hypothetical protein